MLGMKRPRPTWKQGALTSSDQRALIWFSLIHAYTRGIDYTNGRISDSESFTVVNNAFIPQVWGSGFLIGALLVTVGMLFKMHRTVWVGHATLGIFYAGIALALAQPLLFGGSNTTRSLAIAMAAGILHLYVALRTGPVPLEEGEAYLSEILREPNGGAGS